MNYTITNSDDVNHNISLGLMFDAGIGKWGDGFIYHQGSFIEDPTVFENDQFSILEIWERKTKEIGIGLDINYLGNLSN